VNFPVLNVQKFEQSLTLHREILRHLLVIADELEESIKD